MFPLDSKYIILRVYAMPMLKPIGPPYIDKRFFSNFSTKPQFLYEGAIFLRKFNIKN